MPPFTAHCGPKSQFRLTGANNYKIDEHDSWCSTVCSCRHIVPLASVIVSGCKRESGTTLETTYETYSDMSY